VEIESVERHFEILRACDVYPASPGAFDDDVEDSRERAIRIVFAFGQDKFFEVIKPIAVRAAKFLSLTRMMMIRYFP